MPRLAKQEFRVHVFRPNGQKLCVLTELATTAFVAVSRAKKAIYKQGRLAHFYSYVPVSS